MANSFNGPLSVGGHIIIIRLADKSQISIQALMCSFKLMHLVPKIHSHLLAATVKKKLLLF